MLHGRLRTWGLDGEPVRDVMIDRGLEPPIVRYERDEADVDADVEAGDPPRVGVAQFVRRDEVQYQCFDRAVVESIEIGMTAGAVAAILKVDFSLKTGVRFPSWTIDTYLHIAFEDGRVSDIRTGHNGVCVAPRE